MILTKQRMRSLIVRNRNIQFFCIILLCWINWGYLSVKSQYMTAITYMTNEVLKIMTILTLCQNRISLFLMYVDSKLYLEYYPMCICCVFQVTMDLVCRSRFVRRTSVIIPDKFLIKTESLSIHFQKDMV